MDPSLIPLLSGLAGALIGAASSIVTIVAQSHYQDRRERWRMAVDAAIQEQRNALEAAKTHQGRTVIVAPLAAYLYHHIRFIELLDKGELSVESIKALEDERNELFRRAEPQR